MSSSESHPDPYNELDLEQSLNLRADIQDRYWQAMDYLAAIATDKANINNHIQELIQKELRHE